MSGNPASDTNNKENKTEKLIILSLLIDSGESFCSNISRSLALADSGVRGQLERTNDRDRVSVMEEVGDTGDTGDILTSERRKH